MRPRIRILLLTMILSLCMGQLPYSFSEIDSYDFDNFSGQAKAYDIVMNTDSLVFSVWQGDGIYIHKIINDKLVYQFNLRDGVRHNKSLLCYDDIFITAGKNRDIHAYRYDNTGLEKITTMSCKSVADMFQANDSTVFVASEENGLFAYSFHNDSLIKRGSIKHGTDGVALKIVADSHNKIFLANGRDGIRVYTHQDSTLTNEVHYIPEGAYHDVRSIELLNDSIVVIINCDWVFERLQVYNFKDSTFNLITEYSFDNYGFNYPLNADLEIDSKGNIIYSRDANGIYTFSLNNDSLINEGHRSIYNKEMKLFLLGNKLLSTQEDFGITYYGLDDSQLNFLDNYCLSYNAQGLDKIDNSNFLTTMEAGGLQQYQYQDGSIALIEEVVKEANVVDVSVSPDGNYFAVACRDKGYKLFGNNSGLAHEILDFGYRNHYEGLNYSRHQYYAVELTSSQKLYCTYRYYGAQLAKTFAKPSYTWDETYLKGYDAIGSKETIYSLFHEWEFSGISNDIKSDHSGHLFLLGGGAIYEKNSNTSLNLSSSDLQKLDIANNGMLFVACGEAGLKSLKFTDNFVLKSSIDNGGTALGVASFDHNLVFVANGSDGLRAYVHQDTGFTCIAHYNTPGICYDVMVLEDSTIIIADGNEGLSALSFNGWQVVKSMTYPTSYVLFQNFPNPFNPTTTISYKIPELSEVRMEIYDLSGRKIYQWMFHDQSAGSYEITWNGRDQLGNAVSSGVYIYTLVAGDYTESKKMLLLK